MTSTMFFLVMVIIVVILVLAGSIASTIASYDLVNSGLYSVNSDVRSAWGYITVTATICWACFIVLLVIFLIDMFLGGLSVNKTVVSSPSEILIQSMLLVAMVMVGMGLLISAVLAVISTIQLGSIDGKDSYSHSAYVSCIVVSVSTWLAVGTMGVSILLYLYIQSASVEMFTGSHMNSLSSGDCSKEDCTTVPSEGAGLISDNSPG